MTSLESRPRVAIVGSGISGLATAWLLGDLFHVTMFERRATLGLGSQGHAVATQDGLVRVDVPPRVFNAGHYRALTALLAEVGMPTYEIHQRPTFTDQHGRAYLGFDTTGQGTNARNTPRWHPATWRWLGRHGRQLYRWRQFLHNVDNEQIDSADTIATALNRLGFSPRFRDSFLYPMWALMCTCRYEHLDAFPARPLLELARNFALNFATMRFAGGTLALEQRLQRRLHETQLSSTVSRIEQFADRVDMRIAERPDPLSFEHVVLATDPHSTLRLLKDGPWEADRALIAQVPLHNTRMILHTDTTTLPTRLRAPVNMHVDVLRRRSSATLWMNPIEKESLNQALLQSWDPMIEPATGKVMVERGFQRALMSLDSQRAMADLRASMQDDRSRRVWHVGAHVAEGVPLLENGVRSARLVTGLLRERYEQEMSTAAVRTA